MKSTIFIILALILFPLIVIADIRIDNNDLSADGYWEIRENANGVKDIIDAIGTKAVGGGGSEGGSKDGGEQNGQVKTQQSQKVEKGDNQDNQQEIQQQQDDDEDQFSQEQQQQSIPLSNTSPFPLLTGTSGTCLVFFYDSVIAHTLQNKPLVDTLTIRFHDPKYLDQRIIVLKLPLSNYVLDTDDWQAAKTMANYTFYDQLEQKMHGTFEVAYKVEKGKIRLVVACGQGEDGNGKYMELVVQYKKKEDKVWFGVLVTLGAVAMLWLAVRFEKREVPVEKVSIITLYHNVFFYIYLSTFFLIIGMATLPNPTSLLLLCGLLQILTSVKLIRKFQTIIQRVSNLNGYCIFYCGIFIYVWFLFNYFYTPAFVLINSLCLVPQIVHNVRCGNRLGQEYEYLAILVSPQLYFLYLKGYPDNVMHYHPQPFVCLGIVVSVCLQLWIVHNQNLKGPFFFIRKSWLPNYFDFYQEVKLDSKCDLYEQECAICLCSLAEEDPVTVSQGEKQRQLQQKNKKQSKQSQNPSQHDNNKHQPQQLSPYNIASSTNPNTDSDIISASAKINHLAPVKTVTIMVTPCQHKFHPLCLEQWMEYKRECPVDRSAMPMLYK